MTAAAPLAISISASDLEAGLSMSLGLALICMGRDFRTLIGDRTKQGQVPKPACAIALKEGSAKLPYRAWAVVEFDGGHPLNVPLDIWPFGAEAPAGRARR